MRRRLCIAAIALVLGGVGYWWVTADTLPDLDPAKTAAKTSLAKNDGDAESCDMIEPLVVDRAARGLVALAGQTAAAMAPLPRVVLAPGMTQPPRPEGATRRMPYADEDEEMENIWEACCHAISALRIASLFLPRDTEAARWWPNIRLVRFDAKHWVFVELTFYGDPYFFRGRSSYSSIQSP